MENMFNFEKLRVYGEVLELVDQIYRVSKGWLKDGLFGLTSQLRRGVVSILLDIAEGSSRTRKGFRRYLDLARVSVYECVVCFRSLFLENIFLRKIIWKFILNYRQCQIKGDKFN